MYELYCLVCDEWVPMVEMSANNLGYGRVEAEFKVSCGHHIKTKSSNRPFGEMLLVGDPEELKAK
ncbi:hypothetical protein LCGC14_1125970 [marine sediment metagenome]|uniref:Uncharacterized protein n=2 Tax=root TaxID=1 RepID=A0A831QMW9_9FLAO|nr:hypothetical protein [Methylophaga sp.]HEA19641.1 hypothetical protein [Pricia antarctica]